MSGAGVPGAEGGGPVLPSKEDYLAMDGVLLVTAPPDASVIGAAKADGAAEIHLLISADGAILAFNGHVDLGTGVRTALAQIVAEELDVSLARVQMVLGDSHRAPNQGPTIASDTVQTAAAPLRLAAAQARRFLARRAAQVLGCGEEQIEIDDGLIGVAGGAATLSYGDLLRGRRHHLALDPSTPLKPPAQYRIVGQAVPRVDIPDKVSGRFVYVHDVRVPGMLHGRVVRPPYGGRDAGAFIGQSLIGVERDSVAHIPGLVAVVVQGDFVGVVAEREEDAARAAAELKVEWRAPPELPDLDDIECALRNHPGQRRLLKEQGDVDGALASAAVAMPRTYLWPYQLHGSIGPSCAVAQWQGGRLRAWSGSQNPHMLRNDLAALFDLDGEQVEVIRHEAAGCYGRNCADDVAADAALLARVAGRPVRVQLTREQEHVWEPKGAAQVIDVRGGLNADGSPAAYDFSTRYPSNSAPLLATLLTGKAPATPQVTEMGDRTSIPPYDYANLRVVCNDMAPIVRASWLRGVSALPNSFAHECFIDELAAQAGVDPVQYRLRYLKEERAARLVRQVADRAAWVPRTGPWSPKPVQGDTVRGRGFAYALYVHSKFPGYGAAWSAWVADVDVNIRTGEVAVTKVVVGQDTGLVVNPAGVRHQIHGNVIQSTSRVLKERVSFSEIAVATREWGAYPITGFPELPEIDVMMVPAPGEPPVGAGESASVPSAAAIANAIYDATGVRFRAPPFTPDVIRAGLNVTSLPPEVHGERAARPRRLQGPERPRPRRAWWTALAAAGAALAGVAVALLPWRAPLPLIDRPDLSVYSAAALARGRQLAAAGDCAACHTAPGGLPNAGGLAIDTPFGAIHSTNITPDAESGIGRWSYGAFERAMRQGIHQDGRQLYPAFPYTAFASMAEEDLQALYAYLMSQPAVAARTPPNTLAFPFSLRPLLAGWNALFLRQARFQADPARSAQWNRGAYLVEGVGHCGACHTPRNALGAEKAGRSWLAGGLVDGWEAPALTALSHAPVPWTEQELFRYLRTGFSPLHGVAAGPMAPVVREMAALPDEDVQSITHYLASANPPVPQARVQTRARELEARTAAPRLGAGAGLFAGACAACHAVAAPPLFGVKPSLALNSNVHSAAPDNLINVILQGIAAPADPALGYMPGFAQSFSDAQVAELADYVRAQFAPDKAPWADTLERSRHLRRLQSARQVHAPR
jgi:nicotinate dehydrogenase subunit B